MGVKYIIPFNWYVNNILQTSNQFVDMDGTYTYDTGGEGKVLSVNYPKTYSWNGTNIVTNTGNTYTYSFDAMMRPLGLTDQNNNTLVSNVTYNAANQLLTFNSETRQYNNLNQMTRLTVTGALDISYNFPAGTNNGKISTQTDNLSGETVTYQYDSLNRLLSATSNQSWSETYGFDGFGNLLSKTGTGGAPTLSQSVTASTNHIVGQSYDSNGNQTSGPLGSVSYDAENRVTSVSSAGVQYAYDSQNKRIWSSTLSGGNLTQIFYYYGTDGQKLGIYPMTLAFLNGTTPEMTDNTNVKLSTFFGSKRIGTYDRLGTAKYNANGQPQSFYPYGEDRGTVQPNDSLKFATYTRDSATGLDYADQRYYANNFGRFMSADPYSAGKRRGGTPKSPKSWNRYAYVLNDPINFLDPSGRFECSPENDDCDPGCDLEDTECEPDPEPQDVDPPLNCTFVSYQFYDGNIGNGVKGQNARKQTGYYFPTSFHFAATGGAGVGTYQWSNFQWVIATGVIDYVGNASPTIFSTGMGENLIWGPAGGLPAAPPVNNAWVFDSPGLAAITPSGVVNFADITLTFELFVSVTSNGQTADCPTVDWTVTFSWGPGMSITGQETVITPAH